MDVEARVIGAMCGVEDEARVVMDVRGAGEVVGAIGRAVGSLNRAVRPSAFV
jgi:hypothetical protein